MERLIWSSQMENLRGKRDFLKGRHKIPKRNFRMESDVPFRQTSSLIPVPDSLCNWEGFVQMVNASPERTTTIRNFTYQKILFA